MRWKEPCILLTTLLIFVLKISLGQTPDEDSLKKVYRNMKTDDSLRIDAASRFAYRIYEQDTTVSNQWYDSALLIAKTRGKPHLSMIPLGSKALLRVNNGQYIDALPIWSTMHSLAQKIDYKTGMGNALYGKGLTYYYLQQYDTSIEIQKKTLDLFIKLKRPDKALSCYNNMASSFLMLGRYPAALENYKKANVIAAEVKDTGNYITTLGNCGMVYKFMEKYREAMAYYQQAYQLSLTTGDVYKEANYLQKMGTILDSQDSSLAAIGLYRKALAINLSHQQERAAGENQSNIGIAFFELGKYDSAWQYLNESLPIIRKYGDQRGEGIVLSYLGKTLYHSPEGLLTTLGISPSAVIKQSKNFHQTALRIFQEIETPYNEASEWEALANIYQKEGNYKLAFEAMKNLRQLKDSIFKDETKEKILETELKFEQEKQEALLKAEHAAEVEQHRFTQKAILAAAIFILLSAAALYAINKRRQSARIAQKEAELIAEKNELENKALRSQMNPHFIFNALNSIADFVRKNEPEMAEEYLAKFARLMRLVLENSEQKEVTLGSDLETLNLYIQLEALRAGKPIEYTLTIPPDIDADHTLVPPLLLQPFVENSIWHGIMPKKGVGKLMINIQQINGRLTFTIDDNGVGLSEKVKRPDYLKSSSMGMQLTERRIQLLTENMRNSQNSVSISALTEGVRVVFQIPYKPAF